MQQVPQNSLIGSVNKIISPACNQNSSFDTFFSKIILFEIFLSENNIMEFELLLSDDQNCILKDPKELLESNLHKIIEDLAKMEYLSKTLKKLDNLENPIEYHMKLKIDIGNFKHKIKLTCSNNRARLDSLNEFKA